MYLHEIDNGEAVSFVGPSVGYPEVEPLCVFVCVEVIPQPQLIVSGVPETWTDLNEHPFHYKCSKTMSNRYTLFLM